MAVPMTPAQWRAALTAEGVKFHEHHGWTGHNRNRVGAWGDVHMILIHHTAGRGPSDGSSVWAGRPDLPGPLAHSYLPKSGVAELVSSGRANHAGKMARNAYESFKGEKSSHPRPSKSSGTVDGNAVSYGIEISNLGTGHDPYPAAQYDAAVRWAAAICRHHGWSANSIAGHKETSIEGKVDPSFDMNKFRADVAARLAAKPSTTPGKPSGNTSTKAGKAPAKSVDLAKLITAAKADPPAAQGHESYAAGVRIVEAALRSEGLLAAKYASDGSFGTTTVAAYRAWQQRLGYAGKDADGIPGRKSLEDLGKRHGFTVA